MHITLFSFVTAVLLSSLLIVVLYLSRKSAKTDSDAEFWLSGLSLSVLFGTDVFLCGAAVCRCDLCAVTNESTT